jgi:hypothetical protein
VSITLLLIKRTHQANIDKRATTGYNSSLHIVLVGWGDTVYWQENAGSKKVFLVQYKEGGNWERGFECPRKW